MASSLQTKIFEVRDRGTFLPVAATRLGPVEPPDLDREARLLWRAGFSPYDEPLVLLAKLTSPVSQWDPYAWGDRTLAVAHNYIATHWEELEPGAVIDVEFLLGETAAAKRSELES